MGRPWQSTDGNFAGSCLIRLQPGEDRPAELGFVAALALHDVVARFIEPSLLSLKWPNDLLLEGTKLSGILLEREGGVLILGIGVNLKVAPALPDRPTVALADHGILISAEAFGLLLAEAFACRRREWRENGFAVIREAWMERAHPVGTKLWVTAGQGRIEGQFAGLDADGALLLDGVDGQSHRIHAGDVWQGSPPERQATGRGDG